MLYMFDPPNEAKKKNTQEHNQFSAKVSMER